MFCFTVSIREIDFALIPAADILWRDFFQCNITRNDYQRWILVTKILHLPIHWNSDSTISPILSAFCYEIYFTFEISLFSAVFTSSVVFILHHPGLKWFLLGLSKGGSRKQIRDLLQRKKGQREGYTIFFFKKTRNHWVLTYKIICCYYVYVTVKSESWSKLRAILTLTRLFRSKLCSQALPSQKWEEILMLI